MTNGTQPVASSSKLSLDTSNDNAYLNESPSAGSQSQSVVFPNATPNYAYPPSNAVSSSTNARQPSDVPLQQPYYTNYLWPHSYTGYHFPVGVPNTSPSHVHGGTTNPNTYTSPPPGYPNSNAYAAHLPLYRSQTYTDASSQLPAKSSSQPIAMSTNALKNTTTKTSKSQLKPTPSYALPPSPKPPNPEAYKHWDEVIKKFFLKTKMLQALQGFEIDMLVLNPKWEMEEIPSALEELLKELQVIINRISGKQKINDGQNNLQVDADDLNVDITSPTLNSELVDDLNDRKLSYVHLPNGAQPRTQTSINHSISQFLARTRARNDASNRAEFLLTLAEKKRMLVESQNTSTNAATESAPSPSCARVDAKTIDREKQMKYDIAKNGEGPLTKTNRHEYGLPTSLTTSAPENKASSSNSPAPMFIENIANSVSLPPEHSEEKKRKRKLAETESEGSHGLPSVPPVQLPDKKKGRRKGKEKASDVSVEFTSTPDPEKKLEEVATEKITPDRYPALDERLKNVEEHFSVRYVPSLPRTLLARLKYLEDHIIKLEKEYPPWAALHFNQPARGWPPPPRATPVIVPPHLRSTLSSSTISTQPQSQPGPTVNNTVNGDSPLSISPSISTNSTSTMNSSFNPSQSQVPVNTIGKQKKVTSSLHKAVLDRLEVQKAKNEMIGEGSGG